MGSGWLVGHVCDLCHIGCALICLVISSFSSFHTTSSTHVLAGAVPIGCQEVPVIVITHWRSSGSRRTTRFFNLGRWRLIRVCRLSIGAVKVSRTCFWGFLGRWIRWWSRRSAKFVRGFARTIWSFIYPKWWAGTMTSVPWASRTFWRFFQIVFIVVVIAFDVQKVLKINRRVRVRFWLIYSISKCFFCFSFVFADISPFCYLMPPFNSTPVPTHMPARPQLHRRAPELIPHVLCLDLACLGWIQSHIPTMWHNISLAGKIVSQHYWVSCPTQFSVVRVSIICVNQHLMSRDPFIAHCSAHCTESLDLGCNGVMTDSLEVAGWYVLSWFAYGCADSLTVGVQGSRWRNRYRKRGLNLWAWADSSTIGGVAQATLRNYGGYLRFKFQNMFIWCDVTAFHRPAGVIVSHCCNATPV